MDDWLHPTSNNWRDNWQGELMYRPQPVESNMNGQREEDTSGGKDI